MRQLYCLVEELVFGPRQLYFASPLFVVEPAFFPLVVLLNDLEYLASCRKVNAVYGYRVTMVACVGLP